jgi:cytochrome c-type biogenesis protein CcmH
MLLWLGFAVLTAAVVAVLLRPLLAVRTGEGSVPGASAAVYRDQLAEIEAERARGLIGEAEAEAARIEIARRLLAAADATKGASAASALPELRMVAVVLAAALPVLAIVAYLAIGAPNQPGQPFAARGSAPGTASVDQLVAKVEERLRAHPEDGRGWDVIAPVYLRLERYTEAADAFQRALRLMGESPERLAGLAEAHVLINDGLVTEVARKSYERLRALEPERMEPRFWLAVAAEQDGRFEEAVSAYAQLLAEGEPSAGWRPTVAERWRIVRTKLKLPTEPVPQSGSQAKPSASAQGRAPALAKEDVDNIQSLSPEARKQMIEDMVAGLDQRLRDNGRDLDGWQRLIRAYTVLGRREDAIAALARARAAMAGEAPSLEALGTLAQSLGLSS